MCAPCQWNLFLGLMLRVKNEQLALGNAAQKILCLFLDRYQHSCVQTVTVSFIISHICCVYVQIWLISVCKINISLNVSLLVKTLSGCRVKSFIWKHEWEKSVAWFTSVYKNCSFLSASWSCCKYFQTKVMRITRGIFCMGVKVQCWFNPTQAILSLTHTSPVLEVSSLDESISFL